MRIAMRFILIFLILLTVAISAFALICSLGIVSEQQFNALTFNFYDDAGVRAVVAIACIVIIIVSVLSVLIKPKKRIDRSAKILTSRNGSIKISFRAISEMIRRLVLKNEHVLRANVKTSREEDGIDALIILFLSSDANMIEITEKIKHEVDEFLTERCGVKVYDVSVLIDRMIKKTNS